MTRSGCGKFHFRVGQLVWENMFRSPRWKPMSSEDLCGSEEGVTYHRGCKQTQSPTSADPKQDSRNPSTGGHRGGELGLMGERGPKPRANCRERWLPGSQTRGPAACRYVPSWPSRSGQPRESQKHSGPHNSQHTHTLLHTMACPPRQAKVSRGQGPCRCFLSTPYTALD